jgi:putative hemolysin
MVLVARRCTWATTWGWRGLPNHRPAILTRPHQAQNVTKPRMRLPALDVPEDLRRTRSGGRLLDTEGGSFLALHPL